MVACKFAITDAYFATFDQTDEIMVWWSQKWTTLGPWVRWNLFTAGGKTSKSGARNNQIRGATDDFELLGPPKWAASIWKVNYNGLVKILEPKGARIKATGFMKSMFWTIPGRAGPGRGRGSEGGGGGGTSYYRKNDDDQYNNDNDNGIKIIITMIMVMIIAIIIISLMVLMIIFIIMMDTMIMIILILVIIITLIEY